MHELDQLDVVVIVDNETDTLSSIDNTVQASESTGLLDRLEPSFYIDGHPYTSTFDHLCCGCHGFSALLTGHRGDTSRTMLFDVGPYADIWLANAERLAIDLASIEVIFLSHWHWDHSGGLPEVAASIVNARAAQHLPAPIIDLHPDRPDQRGVMLGDGRFMMLPKDPTIEVLEATGATVRHHRDARDLADGFFFASGQIPRTSAFETGLAGHHSSRNGTFEPDPLLLDERYVAAVVAGRGTTVLSACSHAGIVNVATNAQQMTDRPLDLLLGGYHLAGAAMEPRIADTVHALDNLDPALIAPGHCTGWRAKTALAQRFAPSARYAPSVVGTRYRLSLT